MSFSKRQKKALEGKRLGKVQRRILWVLGGGNLEPTEPGELAEISGVANDNINWKAPQLAKNIYSLGDKDLTNTARASTNRALNNLKPLLVRGNTKQGSSRSIWWLSPLGRAVVKTFQDELANGKRIRWDSKTLQDSPSALEKTYNKFRKSQSQHQTL